MAYASRRYWGKAMGTPNSKICDTELGASLEKLHRQSFMINRIVLFPRWTQGKVDLSGTLLCQPVFWVASALAGS
jgi:hypothetical protein